MSPLLTNLNVLNIVLHNGQVCNQKFNTYVHCKRLTKIPCYYYVCLIIINIAEFSVVPLGTAMVEVKPGISFFVYLATVCYAKLHKNTLYGHVFDKKSK